MPRARKRKSSARGTSSAIGIKAIDLFCGAGGLTRGLEAAGIDVVTGVDIDPACEYPFTANNRATFQLKSVEGISGSDFTDALEGASFTLLAGCAPCQPFSTYSQEKPVQRTSDGICSGTSVDLSRKSNPILSRWRTSRSWRNKPSSRSSSPR